MLELLFQGFVEWLYGLILECWEYFASVLFDLMRLDFAYLREHIPIIDTIRQIMLGVGWALLIGNLVFQATRGMAAGLGFDAEDPKLLFTRTFAFSFLLVASPQICGLGLNMTSTVIELLEMPDAVDITFADEASFAGMTGAWLLVVICGIVVMFQTFKLIMEMAERYFILAVLTITSPLAFGMGGSRNTSDIFTGWCRMFGSMCLLMTTNVMFVKMLLSVLSYYPSGLDVLPWMVLVITIVKVAKKADSILARIGLNPAMTGDPLGRGFPGAMTMMVVRSLVSNAAHAISRNGGSQRSGSGKPKPNALTGPRSGGGNTSNVNAPSYANGYHHSTSAQQSGTNPVSSQESVSAQTDTVQTAAEKMAGAFSQAASSANGKQPNSTRKTAVPPGTRRAPGHVAAPKNHAAPTAGKTAPGTPYHPAGTVQPVMGSAAAQNMQQEQNVHSQSESYPRSSATVQNHGGTVLSGAAGKAAGQNPPRSINQPTGTAGKSYHSSNAQGQTVQSESAQQRSTFVQPPETQRRTSGMAAAPNAMPNNPVSPSTAPRSSAQPVGNAGIPNHPNGGQVRNAQAESVQQRSSFVQPSDAQRGTSGMAAAPNATPNKPTSPSATPRSTAQPVGSAGIPNHPNGGQVRNAQAESVQQRSTFVQPPNTAGTQPKTEHPASPASPRSGMAGNSTVPHSNTPPTPAQNSVAGKQPAFHQAASSRPTQTHDTAGTGTRPQQSGGSQNTPVPGTAGTQRTSIGGRYTQPVQQTTRVFANGTTQITQQNHISAQQTGGSAQPSSGTRMDGHSTNREHLAPTTPVSPAAPSSNREAGTSPRSTARPDAARPAEQRASQRPIPAQSGSAEKPIPQTGTQASPVSAASSERQSRKPAAMGSMTAPASVSQESRGPQRSPAAESSAKRPVPQERKAGAQPEPQKKEQTLYHRPGAAGIAPTAVGINTEAAPAAQKPAAEKAAKKPFVPLTGRTPESIPSHLDLHETSQKTTKRPQENTQEVTSDE